MTFGDDASMAEDETSAALEYKNVNRFQCLRVWFEGLSAKDQRKLRAHISSASSFHTLIPWAGFTVGDLTIMISRLAEDLPSAVITTCEDASMGELVFGE